MARTVEQIHDNGFGWARLLHDRAFRDHIDSIGVGEHRHVLPVLPYTTIGEVIGRMVHNGCAGRCILAMADETQPFGFRTAVIEVPGIEEFPYAHEREDPDLKR